MSSPALKYAYFPGCVAQGAGRELYLSTQVIAEAMGIELIELKKAACCGSGTFKETSQLLEDTVNAPDGWPDSQSVEVGSCDDGYFV
jgi:succinate dehydrogenase / fumarate reductase, cytochrome b subunit